MKMTGWVEDRYCFNFLTILTTLEFVYYTKWIVKTWTDEKEQKTLSYSKEITNFVIDVLTEDYGERRWRGGKAKEIKTQSDNIFKSLNLSKMSGWGRRPRDRRGRSECPKVSCFESPTTDNTDGEDIRLSVTCSQVVNGLTDWRTNKVRSEVTHTRKEKNEREKRRKTGVWRRNARWYWWREKSQLGVDAKNEEEEEQEEEMEEKEREEKEKMEEENKEELKEQWKRENETSCELKLHC